MKSNGIPQDTVFQKFGGSIYLKIPQSRLKHLEIQHLKKEDTPNKAPAKIMAQINDKGEHYMSHWNPKAESQNKGDKE